MTVPNIYVYIGIFIYYVSMQNAFEPFSRIRLIPVAVETGLIAGWPAQCILYYYVII